MKLYYSPGACSLSPHIVAREAGIALDLEKVDLKAKQTESGQDFLSISPRGYVPALQLDNGEVLAEGPAIIQYLADLKPESGLSPANGSMPRYRLQEWLTYIGTEIHKTYSPLFNPATLDSVREDRAAYLLRRYWLIEQTLAKQPYLLCEQFSVADVYLFVVTNWTRIGKLAPGAFPAL